MINATIYISYWQPDIKIILVADILFLKIADKINGYSK